MIGIIPRRRFVRSYWGAQRVQMISAREATGKETRDYEKVG